MMRRFFTLTMLATLAGCTTGGTTLPDRPVTGVVLAPAATSLIVGQSMQFTATLSGGFVDTPVAWTISNASIATLSNKGVASAKAPGTATVTAKAGAVSGTATLTVTAGPLASITVTPKPVSLVNGAKQQFTAVGTDASGFVVAITPIWSVAAGGGTITTSGLFTAGSVAGTFANTVQATSETITGSASVIVTAGALTSISVTPNPVTLIPGAIQQFTATGKDAVGNTVLITPVWSVVSAAGTITSAGLFTASSTAGTFTNTVLATVGNITGSATVTVPAGPLASIAVTPNPVFLSAGGTQQFTAVGRDAAGNVIPVTPVWSTDPASGTITSGGLFTAANTAGTFANAVQATSGTIPGWASVTVATGAVDRVGVCDRGVTTICSAVATLNAIGTAVSVRASAFNANGADISASCVFTWSTSGPGAVGIVTSSDAAHRDALVTRTGLGAVSILVSCNGVTGVFSVGP